ncbi:hypothetical protein DL769_009789 [Monosporascus sp. CRB-8-3]|nr:hypothetical protein DL769_009789 [Monosporascus sp. CRB-8-3]
MDPFTTINLACNLLDLVERAIECGKIIKAFHDGRSIEGYHGLKEAAEQIETVVNDLTLAQNKTKHQKSKTDFEIENIIGKVKTSCTSLRDALQKCQPEREGSWRHASAAALRALLKSSEIRKFQKEIEDHRNELNTLIPITISQRVMDMVDRLKGLETQMSYETYQVQRGLERLDESLKVATDDLRRMLESMKLAFHEAQDTIKNKLILKALWYPDIDVRFRAIHEAERNTFGWILKDPDLLRKKESKLGITFTDWLERGSGIFHIAGKAGSGKSTLVKFLCDWDGDCEVENLLQAWAESAGKILIFSKFFFYRVTTTIQQKTWKGLVHSLLHSVLQQVPRLTRCLFPRQWDPHKGSYQDIMRVELGDREISKAFEILLTDRKILDEYRICFFIDGLDEFEQDFKLQRKTHASIGNDLGELANGSKGDVKMCVSSRPLPEFMNTFPATQRIMLENLTGGDIRTLVTNKLDNNRQFTAMMKQSREIEGRCKALRNKILAEANGVFLWVGLILNQLDIALGEGDSVGIAVLERIVNDSTDRNLDDFFKSIMESIPSHHRVGSYYLLAGCMRMSGVLISAPKTNIEPKAFEDILLPETKEQYLTLSHSTLVFDLAEHNKRLHFDSAILDRNGQYASCPRGFQDRSDERLSIRCRGLIDADKAGRLRFTHRAIPESLQHYFSEHSTTVEIDDRRVAEMLTWLALADARSGQRGISTRYLVRLLRECDLTDAVAVFQLLRCIDETLNQGGSDGQWITEILHHFRTELHPGGKVLDMFRQCQVFGIQEK